jgi:DUF971 family protein
MSWPTALTVKNQGQMLHVAFDDGQAFDIPAELARVESPSAEVKGHGPGQEVLVTGKQHVRITKVEPIGTYAVRLIFSDSHATGIFTWPYLEKLGREGEALMAAYRQKCRDLTP